MNTDSSRARSGQLYCFFSYVLQCLEERQAARPVLVGVKQGNSGSFPIHPEAWLESCFSPIRVAESAGKFQTIRRSYLLCHLNVHIHSL